MTERSRRLLAEPHPTRLARDDPHREEILRRHGQAMEAGRPSYEDPATGFSVFTAAFLTERGRCCSTGCRHCPYVE